MQLGHIFAGLLIATFDWNPLTIGLVLFFSMLPNFDVFLVWTKLVPPEYHCANSFTHTIPFAILVSMITLIFSVKYAIFAFISIILHLIIDSPTNTGIMFLYPFSKRKFSLNLWDETGFWGWNSFKGYYSQRWAWVTECILFVFLIYEHHILI